MVGSMRTMLLLLAISCGGAEPEAETESPQTCVATYGICSEATAYSIDQAYDLETCSLDLGSCVGSQAERTHACGELCSPAWNQEMCGSSCVQRVLRVCQTIECVEELRGP